MLRRLRKSLICLYYHWTVTILLALTGIGFWASDTWIDSSFIDNQDFWDNLWHASKGEMAMRILILIVLTFAGLVIDMNSRNLKRSIEEKDLAITERDAAIRELEKSHDKIKLFAYSVAHDLKSPAIGIYGLTKRLSDKYCDILGEVGHSYCQKVLRAAEHVAELVKEINIFIESKELPLNFERIDMKCLLSSIKEEFSFRLDVQGIQWFETDIPEITADRIALYRIFRNLIDNAIKYGGEKLTKIVIEYEEGTRDHVFSISDNGSGIKSGDQDRIFEIFTRIDSGRIEGTGLGLAIVKELVDRHDGKIWVESVTDKGTTFFLSLPK